MREKSGRGTSSPTLPSTSAGGPSTTRTSPPPAGSHIDLHSSHSDEHPEDGPPGYTELSSATTNHNASSSAASSNNLVLASSGTWRHKLASTPGLPNVNILAYLPSSSAILSPDQTTVTISDAKLCSDPALLTSFIQAQAALPPRPQIRIRGTPVHAHVGPDFDIKIDMMRYFVRPPGTLPWNYVKMVEKGEMAFRGETSETKKPHVSGGGGTDEWARRFCKSVATNKAFVIERVPANWNTALLEGRIRNLLASLRYAGKIEIGFAASHTTVIVQPPPAGLLPRFLNFLTAAKKFAVVRSVWPYADMSSEDRSGQRQCAVQNEDDWWEVWSSIIALAIMSRRKGWVTSEDVLDMAMCLKNSNSVSGMSWAA